MKYFIIFILILNVTGFAQNNLYFKARAGFGSYSHSKLQYMNEYLAQDYTSQGFPLRVTESFPSFWNEQIAIGKNLSSTINLGLALTYYSTGGRIHLKDYSGEILIDNIVSNFAFGGLLEINASEFGNFKYVISIYPHINLSDLKIEEKIRINSNMSKNIKEYQSIGFGIEPLAGIEYHYKILLFRIDGGFNLSFNPAYHLNSNNGSKLEISGKKISPDWNGYRIGFSFGVNI